MQIRYFVPSPIKVLKFDEEQLSVKGVSEISDHSVTVCVFFNFFVISPILQEIVK